MCPDVGVIEQYGQWVLGILLLALFTSNIAASVRNSHDHVRDSARFTYQAAKYIIHTHELALELVLVFSKNITVIGEPFWIHWVFTLC